MRGQNRPPVLRAVAAGLFIASAVFVVSPAAADDAETCADAFKSVAIAVCTRAIASAQYTTQNAPPLYASRGIAYEARGQQERASADFDRVFRLDPRFAERDRTDPVAVGDGRFVFCCRAVLLDCRTKVIWAISRTRDDACLEACSRNLRCKVREEP
jgi:hypothetical protein